MHEILSRLHLHYTRVQGVDGTKLDESGCLEHVKPSLQRPLSRGEIACFLSHRACWERIAASRAQFGAVFEDDVHLSPDAAAWLSNSTWIPEDADIIKLEMFRRKVIVDRATVHLNPERQLMRLRSQHVGAAGYILRRETARMLLGLSEKISHPVDLFLFNPKCGPFEQMAIYQMHPALCVQDWLLRDRSNMVDIGSLLEEERQQHKLRGIKKLSAELRRPLRQLVTQAQLWWHRKRVASLKMDFR